MKEGGVIEGEIEGGKVKYCINKEKWKVGKRMFGDLVEEGICKKERCWE